MSNNERTYSLNQIARELDIAASTLRYWKDNFYPFLESVKRGNKIRYRESSIQVFKRIKELKEQHYNFEDIDNVLMREFPVDIDDLAKEQQGNERVSNEQASVMNTDKSESLIDENKLKAIIKQQTNMIQELYGEVEQLKNNNEQLRNDINNKLEEQNKKLEQRDQELMNAIRQLQEQKEEEKRPFWKRIFRNRKE